ncbi:MAG: extracellular solute-binding protein [Candidatus Hydrogenedentes bacterium]|nr:extracellular solute-binding protein [Candidatus Hydrogenedentota bacterium]
MRSSNWPSQRALLFWCVTLFTAVVVSTAIASGCSSRTQPEVVVYTALDEMFSKPILDAFEKKTGIKALPVFDTEASKTTGLVSRIIAEKDRPRADVFWNNEIVQTIMLKQKGLLAPYHSPSSDAIPSGFKDPEFFWTGFAARGRVIIFNPETTTTPPTSIRDLLKPEWSGRAAIAKPIFGTTAAHAAVLFAAWGEEEAKTYFRGLLQNNVAVLAGNATVRDMVANGEYAAGMTDTDDANGAVLDGRPAKWLFPDQEEGGMGALIIPNTVALVKDAPHPDAAQKLIDYLLSPDVEEALAKSRSLQIPLNPAVRVPDGVPTLSSIRAMAVDFEKAASLFEKAADFIRSEFLK